MKHRFIQISLLLIVYTLLMGFTTTDFNSNVKNYSFLKQRLENTKAFTIDVISAMPESDYAYKPTDNVRTYGALASHVVYSIEWNIELMKGTPIKWAPGDENRYTKKDLILYANEQFDNFIQFVHGSEENPILTEKIIDVLNHNAHHRGQMTAYLRMKGITPPNYK